MSVRRTYVLAQASAKWEANWWKRLIEHTFMPEIKRIYSQNAISELEVVEEAGYLFLRVLGQRDAVDALETRLREWSRLRSHREQWAFPRMLTEEVE